MVRKESLALGGHCSCYLIADSRRFTDWFKFNKRISTGVSQVVKALSAQILSFLISA